MNFELLPRIKNINAQKLVLPYASLSNDLKNIAPILKGAINWDFIKEQYDEIIKYATAMRLRTADSETILKRFRSNSTHPTYKALSELGKAIKTIFICKYLISEELRVEINQGLNVVENWNSANSFIFYGKDSEFATNNLDGQEIIALSLHLLQNCMVYINTLMIQKVLLADERWLSRMEDEDSRGLTPLIYSHINPYGKFELNMRQRILNI